MHDFTWFGLLSDKITHHNIHIFSAGLVLLILTVLTVLVHRRLKQVEERLVPEPKGSLANLMEVSVEGILKLMEGVMGPHDAKKYFPLIGALFFYIFLCNLLSLVPGFLPPTDNINTNLACAITVFVYYNIMGVKAHGIKNYLNNIRVACGEAALEIEELQRPGGRRMAAAAFLRGRALAPGTRFG